MKIKVDLDHIKRGVQKNPTRCPITLAMKDAGLQEPCVYKNTFYCGPMRFDPKRMSKYRITHLLPDEATHFLQRFDAGLGVSPFEFEADVGGDGA